VTVPGSGRHDILEVELPTCSRNDFELSWIGGLSTRYGMRYVDVMSRSMEDWRTKSSSFDSVSRTLPPFSTGARSLNHSDDDVTIETRLDYWERFDTTA